LPALKAAIRIYRTSTTGVNALSMEPLLDRPWLLGLITGIILSFAIEAGQRTAARFQVQDDTNRKEQMVAIRDGLFVLVSLLLGFTLALAVPRFAERRSLLIDEANSIGVAYLRAETLPPSNRDQAQQLLRQYVDARIDLDNAGLDQARINEDARHAKQIQEHLWDGAVDVTRTDRSAISAAYMSSLNQIVDLHEKRISASENRIPPGIWILIFSVSLIAVFARGLTLARRFWLTLLLAPLTIAIVVALIADLDTPSRGLIRLDQSAMLRIKAEMAPSQ
jgi:hypothetical protein